MSTELEQLKHHGTLLESKDGPDSENLDDLPPDLDLEKFERGRQFFKRNVSQCLLAMFMSLICGLSVKNLLESLLATAVTKKPWKSIIRYMKTAEHVLKWHYGNVWNFNSDARKSLRQVRRIHNGVRQFMVKKTCSNCGEQVKFNLDGVSHENRASEYSNCFCEKNGACSENGSAQAINDVMDSTQNDAARVYISQYDMSLVQCGFMGGIILHPRAVGIRCSDKELDDYVYFWRWIGHLLGINDVNNICFKGLKRAHRQCKAIQDEILFPAMFTDTPEHFYEMAKAVTDGMNMLTHTNMYSPECYFIIACREAGRQYPERIKRSDRLRVWLFDFVVGCHFYVPGFTWCLNKLMEMGFRCSRMT